MTTEFEIEVVCRDESETQAIIKEFCSPGPGSGIERVRVSEPALELGMIEFSQIVTIVLSFASGVASQVLASWIYDRLTASSRKPVVIRHADVEIRVSSAEDVEVLIKQHSDAKPPAAKDSKRVGGPPTRTG
jgi:hypothetical protein